MALIAASLAIAALLSYFGESAGILRLIGIFLAIGGSVLAIMSLVHWINVEIALRNKKPLPSPNGLVTITIIVSLLGLITIVSLLT